MVEAVEREDPLLKELQAFREQFLTRYKRTMSDEEKRMLDYAEKLLILGAVAKKQTTGK